MMIKDELIKNMKNYFSNPERVTHTLKVLDYAEKLIDLHNQDKLNQEVVIYAAILHDIGIKNAEEKYDSSAGKYQEIEGPPVAREILNSFDIKKEIIDEICEIIANHHSPGALATENFKILYDADWLVNLPDTHDLAGKEIKALIDRVYLTETGKKFAENLFL